MVWIHVLSFCRKKMSYYTIEWFKFYPNITWKKINPLSLKDIIRGGMTRDIVIRRDIKPSTRHHDTTWHRDIETQRQDIMTPHHDTTSYQDQTPSWRHRTSKSRNDIYLWICISIRRRRFWSACNLRTESGTRASWRTGIGGLWFLRPPSS